MIDEGFQQSSHRRWNPLRREWVIVSPHRTQRPWQGQTEEKQVPSSVTYDPSCYLCPGNLRADGQQTPRYDATYIFENDFAALKKRAPQLAKVCFNGKTAGRFAPTFAAAGYRTLVLPSSSPAHATLSFEQKLAHWREILS